MSKRAGSRDLTQPIVAAVVVIATVVAALYWFVIRDDESSGASGPRGDQTFQVEQVPFTFKYPGNFALAPIPEGFVWIAGVGPYDILDVKRIANKEQSLKATRDEIRSSLAVRPDLTIIGDGTDTVGLTKVVRFSVDTAVSGQKLRSNLYYFSMGGASWQLECQSTEAGRAEIDAACSKMRDSFSVR